MVKRYTQKTEHLKQSTTLITLSWYFFIKKRNAWFAPLCPKGRTEALISGLFLKDYGTRIRGHNSWACA